MDVIQFSVKELAQKVFSEYKLEPRKSRSSNSEAEIYLVHNQGIYCMADCKHELSERNTSLVYALGCNPSIDQDWFETSRALAGGDDFCQIIPAIWLEKAIINQQEFLKLQVNACEKTIELKQQL